MANRPNIILVDPDRSQARRLEASLRKASGDAFDIVWVDRIQDAEKVGPLRDADAIVFELPSHSSLPELSRLKALTFHTPVVVVSDQYNESLAREAIGLGAQDYLVADGTDGVQLARAVEFAIERHRLTREIIESFRSDTERAKAFDTMREISRLKEISEFKTQLLNTAAHELSTPLTPIRFQTVILKGSDLSPLEPRQRKAVEILDRNVERLSQLVHDILDVARLEARNFKINPESMDVSAVANEVVDAFRELAREAQVSLEVETEAVPEIDADPQRVAQVFFNLLSNAIKFTPPAGKVRISTRTDGDMVVGSVQDTGTGLRSEDFQRLFQPFSQIEDPDLNTPRRGGTGLGLYITQGIIEQHGGRIWCDSEGPNKGSTFAFALPLQRDPDATSREPAADPSPRKHGVWPFIYFHCPMCDSRDIDMRLLRNTYECKRCDYAWR